ncbi:MAG: hypothetical protein QMB52_13835, partial [Propionivibrio sp.]
TRYQSTSWEHDDVPIARSTKFSGRSLICNKKANRFGLAFLLSGPCFPGSGEVFFAVGEPLARPSAGRFGIPYLTY